MALREILAGRRADVMRRWLAAVQGTFVPAAMPAIELVDHLPHFLDEMLAAMRDGSSAPVSEEASSAAGHGEQRLRLGFSLEAVVREYGALRNAVVECARDAGEELTSQETQVLFDCIISGIAHAVSEYARQRESDTLRQANEHLAFIAHELSTPLASATLAMQILTSKGTVVSSAREVRILEHGLLRANELIDQTLRIARVTSGIELQKEWTTLAGVFADVHTGATLAAEDKGVIVDVEITRDDRIHVDIRLLRSAVSNLVRNAVKYTHDQSQVFVRGDIANGRAVIEIEDRCGGLEPGKVEQVFAPFVRLNSTESGFGLGLAIAKQAVDAHGGTLRVQNMPGKGCVFVLELPVAG